MMMFKPIKSHRVKTYTTIYSFLLWTIIVHGQNDILKTISRNRNNKNDENKPYYDENSNTLIIPKFQARQFVGNAINFQGADIANVHLVNVTIDGKIPHLAIDSLEVKGERGSSLDGTRMATFDQRGGLSTASGVKWDERKNILQINHLSSLSSDGITMHSDLDMQSNKLRNFKLDTNTTFKNILLDSSIVTNTILVNATLKDLSIGSVDLDILKIKSLQQRNGSLLSLSSDGTVGVSNAILESSKSITLKKSVQFTKSISFKEGSTVENIHIVSGLIDGDKIDLNVGNIETNSLTMKSMRDAKSHLQDALLLVRENGSLASSGIILDNEGCVGDMKISGTFDFTGKHMNSEGSHHTKTRGKIVGAEIEGAELKGVTELSVTGQTSLHDLDVKGDAYVDGGVTVGGSVLGSGPYVDVSDKRLKRNINIVSSKGMLDRISKLQAVRYELISKERKLNSNITESKEEIGFIAQEVRELFPDLVTIRPDGYLGLQYSRFVPLLVEGMKDVRLRLFELERENHLMKLAFEELKSQIGFLEAKLKD